jgi:diamine N-acetyltransferase
MRAPLSDNLQVTGRTSGSAAEFVVVRTPADVGSVANLAHAIWYDYYVPLIGRAQVDYMVAKLQSPAAIQAQIRDGYEYFLVQVGREQIGYLAMQEQRPEGRMFISKLYVTKEQRRTGTGRACMEFIEGVARRRGLTRLWLTVNKANPAVHAYERLGFRIAEPIVIDIGGGFVMDDFRMERDLT